MAKKGFSIDQLQRSREPSTTPRQAAYELSTTQPITTAETAPLPPEADDLTAPLRELALRYIGSRRRVGEALLDACRYMSEARDQAEEGQWYLFLRVTGSSPDMAEVQINIYLRSRQNPAFAEKLRSGWLNQTVAGELAKPSTPPEVLSRLLEAPTPPKVADVKRARKDFQQPECNPDHQNVDNPNYSGSLADLVAGGVSGNAASPAPAELNAALHEVAARIELVAGQADHLRADAETAHLLARIEQALARIRRGVSSGAPAST